LWVYLYFLSMKSNGSPADDRGRVPAEKAFRNRRGIVAQLRFRCACPKPQIAEVIGKSSLPSMISPSKE